MSSAKASSKWKGTDATPMKLEKKPRLDDDFDADLDLSSDIKGIMRALQQIRDKAQKDGHKKNEETIGSVASEVRKMLDDVKSKIEKERQMFIKALSKNCKECESSLKNEYSMFQATSEKFNRDKATHLQSLKETYSKFESEKEKLFSRYEQQRKKEKATISELEKACVDKIAAAEDSLKKKQDDKSFNILKRSLGSFLNGSSDDDI